MHCCGHIRGCLGCMRSSAISCPVFTMNETFPQASEKESKQRHTYWRHDTMSVPTSRNVSDAGQCVGRTKHRWHQLLLTQTQTHTHTHDEDAARTRKSPLRMRDSCVIVERLVHHLLDDGTLRSGPLPHDANHDDDAWSGSYQCSRYDTRRACV